jgi:hypothetical protein
VICRHGILSHKTNWIVSPLELILSDFNNKKFVKTHSLLLRTYTLTCLWAQKKIAFLRVRRLCPTTPVVIVVPIVAVVVGHCCVMRKGGSLQPPAPLDLVIADIALFVPVAVRSPATLVAITIALPPLPSPSPARHPHRHHYRPFRPCSCPLCCP